MTITKEKREKAKKTLIIGNYEEYRRMESWNRRSYANSERYDNGNSM